MTDSTLRTGWPDPDKPDDKPADQPTDQPSEPRQEFPGEEEGSIGNRGPDPAEGEDRSTQPDTNVQSPNAGQPQGEDQGTEQQTDS